jgi:hypothetical protein
MGQVASMAPVRRPRRERRGVADRLRELLGPSRRDAAAPSQPAAATPPEDELLPLQEEV